MKYTIADLSKKYVDQGGSPETALFIFWLGEQEKLIEVDGETRKKLLWGFRAFFEGYDEEFMPIIAANINAMQINEFSFIWIDKSIEMTIYLGRPGLLIGKGGVQIDTLRKYLSEQIEMPLTINIVETNIWR